MTFSFNPDVLDTAWLSASESMSPRERDRWRKSLYSVYVGQLPADITKVRALSS